VEVILFIGSFYTLHPSSRVIIGGRGLPAVQKARAACHCVATWSSSGLRPSGKNEYQKRAATAT